MMRLGSWKIFLVLLISIFTATLTSQFAIQYPKTGVDPSWIAALSEATDSDRIFGRDIIFTFGPLHQAYTAQISENITPLIFSKIFFFVLWSTIQILIGLTLGLMAEFSVLVAAMAVNSDNFLDALFYLLPLLCIITPAALARSPARISRGLDALVSITLLSGVLVSTLVKMSFAASSIPAIISILGYQIIKKNRSAIIFSCMVVIPVTVLAAAWAITSKGSITDLITYYLGLNVDIILGYPEAMSYPISKPGIEKFITYILISAATLFLFWKFLLENGDKSDDQPKEVRLQVLISLACAIILVWVVAKSSFVRDDQYHVIHATLWSLSFLILVLGFGNDRLSLTLRGSQPTFVFMAVASPFILVASLAKDTPLVELTLQRWQTFRQALDDTQTLFLSPSKLIHTKDLTLEKIRFSEEQYFLPRRATADIISDSGDVTSLIANQIVYSPRPVFQSYSAYTKHLQMANQDYFTDSSRKPDYVVVDITKDPFILDMPALLSLHRIYAFSHRGSQGSIVYKRMTPTTKTPESKVPTTLAPRNCNIISSANLSWHNQYKQRWTSEKIRLPTSTLPLVLNFEAQSSPFRKILSTLYRPLHVKLEYLDDNDNPIAVYGVSPLTGHGILVSPLVDTNNKLYQLLISKTGYITTNEAPDPLAAATSLRFVTTSLGKPFTRFDYQLYQYSKDCEPANKHAGGS